MSKLIMMSILIATVALPMRRAMDDDPQQGLRTSVKQFWIYNFIYVLLLVFVVPRLL